MDVGTGTWGVEVVLALGAFEVGGIFVAFLEFVRVTETLDLRFLVVYEGILNDLYLAPYYGSPFPLHKKNNAFVNHNCDIKSRNFKVEIIF